MDVDLHPLASDSDFDSEFANGFLVMDWSSAECRLCSLAADGATSAIKTSSTRVQALDKFHSQSKKNKHCKN